MNLLMICHFIPYPPRGGSLQRTFNLLKEISKDNSIYLLALNQKALLPDENSISNSIMHLKEYCEEIKVFSIPTDESRIRWYSMLSGNLFSFLPYSVWRFRSKKLAQEIDRQLKTRNYGAIHLDTIDLAQYIKDFNDIPVIINHHNVESQLLFRRSKNLKNPLARLYLFLQMLKLQRYEKLMARKAATNLVVSDGDEKELRLLAPEIKTDVIPNGTDIEYFTPRFTENSAELVFTGGMGWYPNRDAMIYFCEEIYPLIKNAYPEVSVNIIGRNPPKQIIRMAAKDSSIMIHGFLNDTRDYVARAAVYIVPIRVGGGTRLKILDAFACGKALVSTSIGCEGINVLPDENIIIADSSVEFANCVVNLLGDKEQRQKLGMNARKLVEEQYSWEIIGNKFRQVINRISK